MTARNRGVPVARLREAVARWVERTSLRQAARETGMSPTGLRKVLGGSRIHASTERKLLTWYLRHLAQHADWGSLDADTAASALDLLTEGLPPVQRKAVADGFLARLEEAHRAAALPVPAWIEALRSEPPGAE